MYDPRTGKTVRLKHGDALTFRRVVEGSRGELRRLGCKMNDATLTLYYHWTHKVRGGDRIDRDTILVFVSRGRRLLRFEKSTTIHLVHNMTDLFSTWGLAEAIARGAGLVSRKDRRGSNSYRQRFILKAESLIR